MSNLLHYRINEDIDYVDIGDCSHDEFINNKDFQKDIISEIINATSFCSSNDNQELKLMFFNSEATNDDIGNNTNLIFSCVLEIDPIKITYKFKGDSDNTILELLDILECVISKGITTEYLEFIKITLNNLSSTNPSVRLQRHLTYIRRCLRGDKINYKYISEIIVEILKATQENKEQK